MLISVNKILIDPTKINNFLPMGLYLITAIAAINPTILTNPDTKEIINSNSGEPIPLDKANNIPINPANIPNIP